ncbi:MAG: TIR domain-containing protein, partial [Chloroflexota bacterium]
MIKCFISYSSKDRVTAELISHRIQQSHYDTWLDVDSIRGGSDWESAIHSAIENTDVTIVLVSPDAVESEWVAKEIEESRKLAHTILPLIVRSVDLPIKNLNINDKQVIDLTKIGTEVALRSIVETLAQIEQSSLETRLKALIIEDSSVQHTVIQQVLETMSFRCTVVDNASDAVATIQNNNEHYDLITLDMQLDLTDKDGQHGRSLLYQIRLFRYGIPVIIISSLS